MARVKIDRVVVNKADGVPVDGSCTVTVRGAGTTATLYNSSGGTIANPTTITDGAMNAYVEEGSYDLNISGVGFTPFVAEFEAWRGDSLKPQADPAAGVAGLRTLGTGSTQAASGATVQTLSQHTRLTGPLSDFNTSTWTPVVSTSVVNVNLASPGLPEDWSSNPESGFATGSRVLIYKQTLPKDNGIYIYNGSTSAMTRATDANASAHFVPGRIVQYTSPTDQTLYVYTGVSSPTVGSTALPFAEYRYPIRAGSKSNAPVSASPAFIEIQKPGQYFVIFSLTAFRSGAGNGMVEYQYQVPGGSTWNSLGIQDPSFSLANTHTTLPTYFGQFTAATTGSYAFRALLSNGVSVDMNDRMNVLVFEAVGLASIDLGIF